MSDEFEVIWDGSKAFNRGYLNATAEPARPSVPELPDNSHIRKDAHPGNASAVIAALLTERPHTSLEIEQKIGKSQSFIATVFARFRKRGVLRSRLVDGTDYQKSRARALLYWIEP